MDSQIENIIQQKTNPSVKSLQIFLNENNELITGKNDPLTNVSNLTTRQTYNLSSKQKEFLTLLEECRRSQASLHFLERQNAESSGIMLDFDRLQYSPDREITERHITRICVKTLRIIKEIVVCDKVLSARCFVIQKPKIVKLQNKPTGANDNNSNNGRRDVYKDGFHILIPQIWAARPVKKLLCQKLSQSLLTIFNDISCDCQSADEMMDTASSHVPVFYYGNSKLQKEAYKLQYTIDVDLEETDDGLMTNTLSVSMDKMLDWNMTAELSLTYVHENMKAIHYEPRDPSILRQKITDNMDADNLKLMCLNEPELKLTHDMLQLLPSEYYDKYDKWIRVLFALHRHNYKTLAKTFSMKSKKYVEQDFEYTWESIQDRSNSITIRSIHYWAKQHRPQDYEKIFQNSYKKIFERKVYEYDGTAEQGIVAELLYNILGDKFVVDVDSMDRYTWWEFVTPDMQMEPGQVYKWRRVIKPDNIYLFIGDRLPYIYGQILDRINERKKNAQQQETVKYWSGVARAFKSYTAKLQNSTFQNGVVKIANFKFRRYGFCKTLDTYDDIIGVGNGVLKLAPEPSLIKTFHEYTISRFTATNYFPYNPECPEIQLLEQAYKDTYPEEDARLFWKLYHSQFIDPHEVDAIFGQQVGGGSNGKSFWVELLSNTIGEQYSIKLPITLLTSTREKASETNTALMAAENKFYIYFSEPDGQETLNSGRVKELFSGEKQSGNDKYGKQRSFRMRASPLAVSNYDFETDCTDEGFWRRIYYYKTKMKFVSNPDPNNKYEKKKDLKFINEYKNDPKIMQAMLSMLVYYNNILRNKYDNSMTNVPCQTIRRETENFRNRKDTVNRFIIQMVVQSPLYEEITITELAAAYIDWYRANIKKIDVSVANIVSKFENSRLAKYLHRKADTTVVLRQHRIKMNATESLREGESMIINMKDNDVCDTSSANNDDQQTDIENCLSGLDDMSDSMSIENTSTDNMSIENKDDNNLDMMI